MKGLQGMYLTSAMLLHIKDSFGRCKTCSHGGDIGNFALDRRFTQIAVVVCAVFSHRGIDNQLDLAVGDQIQNFRTSFGELL